ncbi:MAG: response regulator [Bdellovibrionales bacterium]|nr:response regulator [Bdellovibrionales bacterium]
MWNVDGRRVEVTIQVSSRSIAGLLGVPMAGKDLPPERKLILIVEDDESLRSSIEKLLLSAGYSVKSAGNGLHGQQLLRTGSTFHLILSDLKMPGQTGLQLLNWVRNSENFQDIPFLIFTASMAKQDLVQAAKLGVSEYILKPSRNQEILHKISKALANAEITSRTKATA